MTVDQPGSRYTMTRVYQYITAVEVAYSVSIKPYVNFGTDPRGHPDISVTAWGSGGAFDLIPTGIQPRAFHVYDDELNGLGEALYYAVKACEALLAKVREPIGARPSL